MSASPCDHQHEDGRGCGGFAIANSLFCWVHTPGLDDERADARRRGGQVGKPTALPASTPDLPLRTHQYLVGLSEKTINDVRAGRVDPRVANSIGMLAGISRVIMDQAQLAVHMDALEAVLGPTRREAVTQRRKAAASQKRGRL